jgi:hypothetical protein
LGRWGRETARRAAMPNRIVVRYRDGRVLKGHAYDFSPQRKTFHLVNIDARGIRRNHEVQCADLKAIFFVKTFEGDKEYVEKKEFGEIGTISPPGLKMKITLYDGEIITGASPGYSEGRQGFFVTPIDPECNNNRIYIVSDAAIDVKAGLAATG